MGMLLRGRLEDVSGTISAEECPQTGEASGNLSTRDNHSSVHIKSTVLIQKSLTFVVCLNKDKHIAIICHFKIPYGTVTDRLVFIVYRHHTRCFNKFG
jgi:hypothetical protein